MQDENKITQSKNTVHGNMAGQDQYNIENKIYMPDPSKPTRMARLIEKFRKEKENDTQFQEQIQKLTHYSSQVPDEDVLGLEPKLKESGHDGLLAFAQKTKELFSKKLAQYQFSESAQQIHAYLLTEVYNRFNLHVLPAIQKQASQEEVNQKIQEHIISPIDNILEENVLELYPDEISGMLYFLTGNCHLRWK